MMIEKFSLILKHEMIEPDDDFHTLCDEPIICSYCIVDSYAGKPVMIQEIIHTLCDKIQSAVNEQYIQ